MLSHLALFLLLKLHFVFEFKQFIRKEYIPNARKTIAAFDLPNGEAYYRSQIFEYTTLDLTPDQIHAIGLEEVARIRNDMNKIIKDLKFEGDFPIFLTFLRTDPQFYAKTPHELLAEASYLAKRVDGMLPIYFGKLPRKSYGIAPVPADIAPTYTTGRYAGNGDPKRPSYYWVNTSLLDQRPMWALPALSLHEAVPGHHLQIALAGEQGDQPEFRRTTYISAFGEGWALYAEHLGVELGNKFDIRAFHDHLLSLGSVPLSILDSEMRAWTMKTKQALEAQKK